MSNKRQLIVVVGALGSLVAAFAVTQLVKQPKVRERLGMEPLKNGQEAKAALEAKASHGS